MSGRFVCFFKFIRFCFLLKLGVIFQVWPVNGDISFRVSHPVKKGQGINHFKTVEMFLFFWPFLALV